MAKLKAGNGGYALIELIAAFAVVAMIAGLCLPVLPPKSNDSSLQSLGMDIANVLRDARTLSASKSITEAVRYDARRNVLEGAGRRIQLGPDVALSFKSGPACAGSPILFRPDGTNCGSVLRVSRAGKTIEIRVNWIDGDIELVSGS